MIGKGCEWLIGETCVCHWPHQTYIPFTTHKKSKKSVITVEASYYVQQKLVCSVALVYACGFHEKGHTRGRPLHTCVTQCVMDIFSHIGTARVYDLV